jgi:outer membrane protein TolC
MVLNRGSGPRRDGVDPDRSNRSQAPLCWTLCSCELGLWHQLRACYRLFNNLSIFQLALRSVCLTAVSIGAGCSTEYYRRSADTEATRAIADKASGVFNADPKFGIEQTNVLSLSGLPLSTNAPDFLGPEGAIERGAPVMSLQTALEVGVHHSRNYQTRREQVYLQALDLTLARHQFTPLFNAAGQAVYQVTTVEATEVGLDPVTGALVPVLSDNLVERNSVRANGAVSSSWLIRDVGRVSAAATTDFFRFLSGSPGTLTSSQIGATFFRPLWRNAGFKAEMESLTLAERSLLYSVRDFTRYRKQFSVDVAATYYRVLQARDTVRNTYLGYQNFKRSAERTRALVKEGRMKVAELGRLEQQELSQETSWIGAIRNYKLVLDSFKMQLGIPTDTNLILDEAELERLSILHPKLSLTNAIDVALATRLDLQNLRQQHEDTDRAVSVQASFLKPRVDVAAAAGFSSKQETLTRFPVPDINRYQWNAGLNIDPGLDRKAERNSYRAALIRHEQSGRSLTEAEEGVTLQVREDFRTLDQDKRSYENSELGVKLAQRRLDEQDLLAELGRGRAQDQVDAQNDLTAAKNQRTEALVEHTIARLRFWEHLGILYIKDSGQWREVLDAEPATNH